MDVVPRIIEEPEPKDLGRPEILISSLSWWTIHGSTQLSPTALLSAAWKLVREKAAQSTISSNFLRLKCLITSSSALQSLIEKLTVLSTESSGLSDVFVTIEYRLMQFETGGGVYVIPSPENPRVWKGAIFGRRNAYAAGVYEFELTIPPLFPSSADIPSIRFTKEVLHPYIDPDVGETLNGELQLIAHVVQSGYMCLGALFHDWNPAKHHIYQVRGENGSSIFKF